MPPYTQGEQVHTSASSQDAEDITTIVIGHETEIQRAVSIPYLLEVRATLAIVVLFHSIAL